MRGRTTAWLPVAWGALFFAGCVDAPVPSDGGVDAGQDAGARDSGSVTDSGAPDATMDAGADSGTDAGIDAGPIGCVGPPGLYAEGPTCTELAEGVRAYHPRFPLWSDGDAKERYVFLPPGTQIDTTSPDRWVFPQGTRLYKTFSIDGVRLETRVLEKVGTAPGVTSWTMTAYAWSADQLSVHEVDAFVGETNVLDTEHDIPSRRNCVRCHSLAQVDAVDGFSAIQLNHDEGGVTLQTLIDEGWMTSPIARADATIPGDATAQAALGYLHSNCGNCHGGPEPEHGLALWSVVGGTDVTTTPTWTTAVCRCSVWTEPSPTGDVVHLRVAPHDPDLSVVVRRMATRVPTDQMPPIGTEVIDTDGMRIVSEWIASLAEDANGCPRTCP